MVTAEGAMEAMCPNCHVQMFLEEGCYRCGTCGSTPCDSDDSDEEGPRTVDELPW